MCTPEEIEAVMKVPGGETASSVEVAETLEEHYQEVLKTLAEHSEEVAETL